MNVFRRSAPSILLRAAIAATLLAIPMTRPIAAYNYGWYSYAGYMTLGNVNGIDGYVGHAGTATSLGTLSDLPNQHIAHWIGIYQDPSDVPNPDLAMWMQAGITQGWSGNPAPCSGPPGCIVAATGRMYAEENSPGYNGYRIFDLGASRTNYAFYVTTSGARDPTTHAFIYQVRVGRWANPPAATGFLASSQYPAWAMTEVMDKLGEPMTVNNAYFGMNSSWVYQRGYGLSLWDYSTGWHGWTPSYMGYTCSYVFADMPTCPTEYDPPFFHWAEYYFAFSTGEH
jgi:hypothetical protein